MFVDMCVDNCLKQNLLRIETTAGVAGSFITAVLVVQLSDSGSVAVFCSSLLLVQFDLLATPHTSLSPGCHVRYLHVRF